MCLILFQFNVREDYWLVLGANRDEFYHRPTSPMHFWEDSPDILAGKDLQAGGTWMGISLSGRFAALTNYRDPASVKTGAPSRGNLVLDFLQTSVSPKSYLEKIHLNSHEYNGFNLLTADRQELFWYSNRSGEIRKLDSGIYGLSNRILNTPWPKVEKARDGFQEIVSSPAIDTEAVFRLLADRSFPPETQLPDTGIGIEWERILSPVFIVSPSYGTRSSYVLLIGKNGRVRMEERSFCLSEGRVVSEKPRVFTFDFQ
jgi:uncharacterized protein with NRDE domain